MTFLDFPSGGRSDSGVTLRSSGLGMAESAKESHKDAKNVASRLIETFRGVLQSKEDK